jgi:hypothetical protein
MSRKKEYKAPVITKVVLDNSISLVMMTAMPPPPDPRTQGSKGDSPFASPFSDKPFN